MSREVSKWFDPARAGTEHPDRCLARCMWHQSGRSGEPPEAFIAEAARMAMCAYDEINVESTLIGTRMANDVLRLAREWE